MNITSLCFLSFLLLGAPLINASHSIQRKCIAIGLLGQFSTQRGKFNQSFGKEIKRGAIIAKEVLENKNNSSCFYLRSIDFGSSLANIPGLIRRHSKKGVKVFVGLGTTNQATVAHDALRDTKSILFSPTASSDELLERPHGRTILMYPTNTQIGEAIADFVSKRGIKRISIVYARNNLYSRHFKNVFMEQFRHREGKVLATIPIRSTRSSLRDLQKLKALPIQAVFLPLFEIDAAKVIAQLRHISLVVPIIGTDSWGTYSSVLQGLVQVFKSSMFLPVIYDRDAGMEQNLLFLGKYKSLYSDNPTDLAAFSYDAVRIAVSMIDKCGPIHESTATIESCLKSLLPIETTTGTVLSTNGLSLVRKFTVREKKF